MRRFLTIRARERARERRRAAEDGATECLSLCLESKEIDTISGDKVGALSARTAALGAGAGGASHGRVSKVAGDAALGAAAAEEEDRCANLISTLMCGRLDD